MTTEYLNRIKLLSEDDFSDEEKERFWSFVEKGEPDQCWEWKRRFFRTGYGVTVHKRSNYSAHRVAAVLGGIIPTRETPIVCHKCDNQKCCNPSHLFLGTSRDNAMDTIKKGRHRPATGENHSSKTHPEKVSRGENHGTAKLKDKDIPQILKDRAAGLSYSAIGRKYGVYFTVIYKIIAGQIWRHIPRVGLSTISQ